MFETAKFFEAFENLVKAAHDNSKEKGFWNPDPATGGGPDNVSIPTKLLLMVSEPVEAFEAYRKGAGDESCDKDCTIEDRNDPRGYRRLTNMEEEMADIVIRVADFCGWKEIDLGLAVFSKMAYNHNRPKMHGKAC